jgi:ABC-2 type transport system ATP-binding protein
LGDDGGASLAEADGMLEITAHGLTKDFGRIRAVDDVSFDLLPGSVIAFLGPNGSGKTTLMRMLLGLVKPTSGSASIGGVTYAQLDRPAEKVGAVLERHAFHDRRTARNHLRILAVVAGIPRGRVDEVLALVGLDHAADRPAGTYSLGMAQRLTLAGALLSDPAVLILDEPTNGLDPAGVHWLRGLLRGYADQGRTIVMSSHTLAEVERSADEVLILAAGRLRAHRRIAEIESLEDTFLDLTTNKEVAR